MKRTATITLALVFTLAVAALLWPNLGSQAQAQTGCMPFQAIAQAYLPFNLPAGETWGGPLYGMLGGVLLQGVLSGNDGEVSWRGVIGQGRAGSYRVCLDYPGCAHSFTYEVQNAVFPRPPGHIGFGRYIGNTARIVEGTGRFQSASGNLNVSGPYIAWQDGSQFGFSGRWNPEISGNICGIQ